MAYSRTGGQTMGQSNVALEEPSLVLHAVIEAVSAERNVVLVLRGEVVQEHLGQDKQRGESGDIE